MTKSDLKIIPFTSTHKDFKKLYELENTLDYHIKDWGTVEMLKYHASLIPEKCKPETNFLSLNNEIFGYGYSAHDEWAFDPTLLDSSISFPSKEKYLPHAQEYLDYQISVAQEMGQVKTLRAWLWHGNNFYTNFYKKNGFEITLTEYLSLISLENFRVENFSNYISRFKEGTLEIVNLEKLQEIYPNWEEKLYELWHRIEKDVPTDLKDPGGDKDSWRGHFFTPWFKAEDLYIVIDGEKWVALSSYNRSDITNDTISTELTGVHPDYRRKGICMALKLFALEDLKKKGFKKVFTGNEENNPMFQINLILGFKKIATEVGCKLEL
tara:strand:+ start:497 stop:1468 length:972 start_codon:yes stop_codon:yes gene_type:complete